MIVSKVSGKRFAVKLNFPGLVVDLSSSGGGRSSGLGFAQTQELREAIKSFSQAKKERFGSEGKAMVITDTNVLDKLGIVFRSYSLGPWKSVNGTFTEPNGWTPPQRENLTDVLGDLNDQLITDIEGSRGGLMESRLKENADAIKELLKDTPASITTPIKGTDTIENADSAEQKEEGISSKLRTLMDIAPLSAEESHSIGLVDLLAFKLSPFRDRSKSAENDSTIPTMPFRRYMIARMAEVKDMQQGLQLPSGFDGDEVGVGRLPVTVGLVYLVGTIMRGDGPFGSNTVARAIVDAARDKHVDAIVFRIDSGGGDVVATETLWDAVRVAQKILKKPVIASYGNISASGGYYASSGCDRIFCSPGTITGSIGVAAARPHITPKTLAILGDLHVDEINFSEGAKTLSVLHDIGSDEDQTIAWKRFKATAESVYRVFKRRVMEGRGISEQKIEGIAGGRIWSGLQAKENGLVDELGGLEKAISVAAKLGLVAKHGSPEAAITKLKEYQKSHLPPVEDSHRFEHGHPTMRKKEKPQDKQLEILDTLEMDHDVDVRIFPRPRSIFKRLAEGDILEDVIGDVTKDVSVVVASWVEDMVRERVEQQWTASQELNWELR
ncbi:hypothetical protein HDU67_006457 [Dinochytrium kinnereticum]|nr:hypothetical protein HDU67_006457 [Dinochytrium kinnereticum]